MAVSITIQYSRSEPTPLLQSYDLKALVESATDMPKEIFVFQRGVAPATPAGLQPPSDRFICIADPVDLEEYPVGAPALDAEMPYYRLSEVTMRFRSMTELEFTRDLIEDDVQRLVAALKASSTLPVTEEVTYG
jgi:hypothetical protein